MKTIVKDKTGHGDEEDDDDAEVNVDDEHEENGGLSGKPNNISVQINATKNN